MTNVLNENQTPDYWNDLYLKRAVLPRPVDDFEAAMLRAYTEVRPGMRALDVGCGMGELAARIAGWGLNVTGIDFSLIAIARANAAYRDVNAYFDVLDVNAGAIPLYLEPSSFDLICCRMSLTFLDQARFLGDVRRWLAPRGTLHVTTLVRELAPTVTENRGMSLEEIDALASQWKSARRYHLENDGSVTCLVLQDEPA
ncbi:methyltransferase domain-containing protein [Streptomyces sp. NBC_00470]|uniref:class I SAM-dependent methyltransferase n=1 Tax=Streptomyces sp. NBC_00470 TaxID=2975753 RepID=UPI002F914CF3